MDCNSCLHGLHTNLVAINNSWVKQSEDIFYPFMEKLCKVNVSAVAVEVKFVTG